jgi:hypothetical protein
MPGVVDGESLEERVGLPRGGEGDALGDLRPGAWRCLTVAGLCRTVSRDMSSAPTMSITHHAR